MLGHDQQARDECGREHDRDRRHRVPRRLEQQHVAPGRRKKEQYAWCDVRRCRSPLPHHMVTLIEMT